MVDLDVLFGPEVIEALQAAFSPALAPLFLLFTLLGEDYVYMALIAITYWCVNKRAGVKTAYVLLACAYLNYWLKMSFAMDKPPSEYRLILEDDVSYGFPSGHTQNAVAFWGWVGLHCQKAWMRALSLVVIFLIGLSRIYLGAHYLGDVLGGALFGAVFLVGTHKTAPYLKSTLNRTPRRLRNSLIPLVSVLLFGLSLAAFPDTTRGNAVLICGNLFGFSLGVPLESKYVDISTAVSRRIKTIRAAIGLATVFGLHLVLSTILNALPLNAQILLDFLRYATLALTITLITPLIFKSLEKLAVHDSA